MNLDILKDKFFYVKVYFIISVILVCLTVFHLNNHQLLNDAFTMVVLFSPLFEVPFGILFFILIKKLLYRLFLLVFIILGMLWLSQILSEIIGKLG